MLASPCWRNLLFLVKCSLQVQAHWPPVLLSPEYVRPSTATQERGYEVPLHVDAANGGLIAPMLQPDVIFDFRLKCVGTPPRPCC